MKNKILELVLEYTDKPTQSFRPGIDPVPVSGAIITPEDIAAVVDAALDGWFTESTRAKEFAKKLRKYVGTNHASLCNSGSSANLLAVTACKEHFKVPDGKKVITTALAFSTTVAPIIQNNLIPLFVDVKLSNLNVSEVLIMGLLHREDVAGVILAHTLGFPYDAGRIADACERHGKFFIEDCADALGTQLYGTRVGGFGDCSTFSFFPAHHITTGEGGAVLCNSGILYNLIQSYMNWGRDCWCIPGKDNTCNKRFEHNFPNLPEGYDHKYVFSRLGYNLKMTELSAALGNSQIDRISELSEKRFDNFEYLENGLLELIHTVYIKDGLYPSPFGFPVIAGKARELIKFLECGNIKTRPIFTGNITRHPMMEGAEYEVYPSLKNSDLIMENCFWIGCHDALTKAHLDYVIEVFEEFFNEQRQ